jgi:hypothetical protein
MKDYVSKASNVSKRFPEVIAFGSVPLTALDLELANAEKLVLEGWR